MNWNTIYIKGNGDFWSDVNKKLNQSNISFLPGIVELVEDGMYQGLYWVDKTIDVRTFKEAITGKLIWKYRLRFFNEIEEVKNEKPKSQFTSKEKALMNSMRTRKSRVKKSINA